MVRPEWTEAIPLAAAGVLASAILFIRALLRRPRAAPENYVIIDGSNIMYWKKGVPDIETVRDVVRRISALGYMPGVMFDANAGYLLKGRYQHHREFARHLKLPEASVMVVPKGTPADAYILRAARDMRAVIVTNDRYRDWADEYPEVQTRGHLNRGGYRDGKLWLQLQPLDQPVAARAG
ncbi:hypothetical protein GO499_03045 [Algicella marina]|uniref:RNase NYN domain-containing protein n=1 Tax=Algicella marina TaxID=2683284 RepID=A0A6P1T5E8_9RHOB|nr:hypothetical protein GO499_03045 [Algicella marina]